MGAQSPSGGGEDSDRRDAPRMPGRVHYSAGRVEGEGLIHDLSLTGARVEEVSQNLAPGTRIELYFSVGQDRVPIHAQAEVVRQSRRGFAIRFVKLDNKMKDLLFAALPPAMALNDD